MLTKQINTLSESTPVDIAIVQNRQYTRIARTKVLFYITLTAIFVLAFSPNYNALPSFVTISDLLNHATAFTFLFLLLSLAYPPLSTRSLFIILFGNAVWIEAVQYFLPSRSTDWRDIIADSVGMLVGYLLISLFRRFRHAKTLYI